MATSSPYWRVHVAGLSVKTFDTLEDALYSLIDLPEHAGAIQIERCQEIEVIARKPWARFERMTDKRMDGLRLCSATRR